jgi:hypothetical protein
VTRYRTGTDGLLSRNNYFENIGRQPPTAYDVLWNPKFEELKAFKETNGHFVVGYAINTPLYDWMIKQKREKKNGKLSASRSRALDDIGFFEAPNAHDVLWNAKFEELKAFKETNGHFVVGSAINKPLYDWMRKQKREKKDGKLSASRSRALDDIGFL